MTVPPDLIASHIRNLIDEGEGIASASDLARRYSVRRRVVHEWARRDGFPKPLGLVAWRTSVYLIAEVDAWRLRHEPTTGLTPPDREGVSR